MTTNLDEDESRPRLATVVMVVSTINLAAMALYSLIALTINGLLYPLVHGHQLPGHGADAHETDSVGHNVIAIPWELFAAGGLVMLVISLIAWPRSNRIEPESGPRVRPLQTGPGWLATIAFFGAGAMAASVGAYSRLLTAFDPYFVGPLLALAAGLVALRRWQLDAASASNPDLLRSARPPSGLSRLLGVALFVDFLMVIVVGFGGVAANQLIYLNAHAGHLPPSARVSSRAGTDIWNGYMPLAQPWWVFVVCSGVLLVITLASWPVSNQFGPQLSARVFFRRTTSPPLVAFGLLFFGVELTLNQFYSSGAAVDAAFRGPALALVVVIVAVIRSATAPASARRAARSHSQNKETVGSHG